MFVRFEDWANEIENYCRMNGLSFEKAKQLCRSANADSMFLQYHDPAKGNEGLRDETPMPLVLYIRKENGKLIFEQTEYTRKYLGVSEDLAV